MEVKSCPAVLQYALAADGRHGAPELAFVKNAIAKENTVHAIELVIVSGPLGQPGAHSSAIRIAQHHADAGLRIAFCLHASDDSTGAPGPTAALLCVFDAVFLTTAKEAAPAARRLVRSLMVPADSIRWIGCEWADLRALVASTRTKRAHHGFGAARCDDGGSIAADAAYADALAQLDRQGGILRRAQAVCLALVTATPDLAATEAITLVTRLRCTPGSRFAIFLSIGCDESLPVGTLEVSLFAFGADDSALAIPARSHLDIYLENSFS